MVPQRPRTAWGSALLALAGCALMLGTQGCEGGSSTTFNPGNVTNPSPNPTPNPNPPATRLTPLTFSINWGARTRALNAPSSALSLTLRLPGAAAGGGDFTFTVNRDAANLNAFTQNVVTPGSVRVGTYPLSVVFRAEANEGGAVVGTAGASVTIADNGTGIGDIATEGTIRSVGVPAQTFRVGETKDLVVETRGANGAIIPVTPGSINATVAGGTNNLTTVGVQGRGVAEGFAQVNASVDGVSSGTPGTVTVLGTATVALVQQPNVTNETSVPVPAAGAQVAFGPNSLTGSVEVTTRVQPSDALVVPNPGLIPSGQVVGVSFNTTQLTDAGIVYVRLPAELPADASRTMAIFSLPGKDPLGLPVTLDPADNTFVVAIPKAAFDYLASAPTRQATGPVLLPPFYNIAIRVIAFAREASARLDVSRFSTETNNFLPLDGSDLREGNRRIAFVLHGYGQTVSAMTDMARYLANLRRGDGTNAYTDVLGVDYDSLARIRSNGDLLGVFLRDRLSGGTTRVDIFGYSMGGLVGRAALELANIGNPVPGAGGFIARLFTFGTPHNGIPRIAGLTAVAQGLLLPSAGVVDLIGESPFIGTINEGGSPYASSTRYIAFAGNDWADYTFSGVPVGGIVRNLYLRFYGISDLDGLVPRNSAQFPELARESDSFLAPNQAFPVNHGQLNGFFVGENFAFEANGDNVRVSPEPAYVNGAHAPLRNYILNIGQPVVEVR